MIAYLARDNVPGCDWQTESDDLEWLADTVYEHLIDEHPPSDWDHVTYTHRLCGAEMQGIMTLVYHIETRACASTVVEA